jgi:pimeloyl-ACP methyl ester carboxylesterase
VVAFLDAAGVASATLVGHSGSCLTARQVAEVHPERVARLVLIGSPVSLSGNEAVLEFHPGGLTGPEPFQWYNTSGTDH